MTQTNERLKYLEYFSNTTTVFSIYTQRRLFLETTNLTWFITNDKNYVDHKYDIFVLR